MSIRDDTKGRMRFTPTCNCKHLSEGYAEQIFKADDGKKTRIVLSWDTEGGFFAYMVYKWEKQWLHRSTEMFLRKN